MKDLYVGLMSGTSMDGIDAVLARFSSAQTEILATHSQPYPADLQRALLEAIRKPLSEELDLSGELNRRVGECFRDAAQKVIANSRCDSNDIRAIGSHGQTLRHRPDAEIPFSLQIGDPEIIAGGTNITTVANFRQADMAAGGQGAPLVPPFHEWMFRSREVSRAVVNIGGIANITVLPADETATSGFDTGPGNGLMDAWARQHLGTAYDVDGEWAASGLVNRDLLTQLLQDPYFQLVPPKSTGFEYFNPNWLAQFELSRYQPADVQATLCNLTAKSIADAVSAFAPRTQQVFICGGGIRNKTLMTRLTEMLPGCDVASTAHAGLDPGWVEAAAFAWLAMRTVNGQTGNLPSVTGASHKVVLGDIHSP